MCDSGVPKLHCHKFDVTVLQYTTARKAVSCKFVCVSDTLNNMLPPFNHITSLFTFLNAVDQQMLINNKYLSIFGKA